MTAVKNHGDEGSYFQRDLDTYHRQLQDVETQRHRAAEDHHSANVEHHFEKGDFLALTKSKEDGENDIFLKNSELLGIQVNSKKTDSRYKDYIERHEKLVREYSDESMKLKTELSEANSRLN